MRSFTEQEENNIRILTGKGIELSFLMPTATGLGKSIMDAILPLRNFLVDNKIHNYDTQQQGPNNKVLLPAFILKENDLIECQASLYRPKTKKGDPRIWFSGLKSHTQANDILGIFVFNSALYVLNLTKGSVEQALSSDNTFSRLISSITSYNSATARELLSMIAEISKKGPVPAIGTGDTAIGRTLETLLGIKINSRKEPDYKGIELKSFRSKGGNRKNLFAKVANWKLSKFKSSAEILDTFGYWREEDFKLYCTVSSLRPNPQGLALRIESELGQMVEYSTNESIKDFAIWELKELHTELRNKHRETFWVEAESTVIDGIEHFHFKNIEHTRSPIASQFDILLEQGIITLDHLIKRRSNGRVSEKGPLFKIKPNKLDLLFPPSKTYLLT